ncbi:MAG: hypothetical protein J3K34DRAFT_140574 [Monoraphidium minutum]|nr:MAG: hypothetical protein J3K34DRAFT_140574 [Monoraphidium minutum]
MSLLYRRVRFVLPPAQATLPHHAPRPAACGTSGACPPPLGARGSRTPAPPRLAVASSHQPTPPLPILFTLLAGTPHCFAGASGCVQRPARPLAARMDRHVHAFATISTPQQPPRGAPRALQLAPPSAARHPTQPPPRAPAWLRPAAAAGHPHEGPLRNSSAPAACQRVTAGCGYIHTCHGLHRRSQEAEVAWGRPRGGGRGGRRGRDRRRRMSQRCRSGTQEGAHK